MRVLVTGSHGLIGSALTDALERDGDSVVRLARGVQWDPEQGVIDESVLDNVDAVVHLAGEGIGDRRWSDEHKRKVFDSRVKGTTALATAIARRPDQITAFVCGSAVGAYGDRGDEVLTEDSATGTQGFFTDVVAHWEAAAQPAAQAGVRTVLLRTGLVLSGQGGLLAAQLTPFRLGLGGWIGNGRQWFSWVSIHDEVGAIRHALDNDAVEGPVNATAPNPVTNKEFAKALGRVLGRPVFVPIPTTALRAMFGREMTEEMMLSGQRALPAKLEATGYRFQHAHLEDALRAVLGREKR